MTDKAIARKNPTFKFMLLSLSFFALGGLLTFAYADETFGDLAENVVDSISPIVELIVALCYVGGIGFAGAGVMKFKQYKDNPTQIPLGTPFMLLFVGIALVWLPTLVRSAGSTIFGTGADAGSADGRDIFD